MSLILQFLNFLIKLKFPTFIVVSHLTHEQNQRLHPQVGVGATATTLYTILTFVNHVLLLFNCYYFGIYHEFY